MSMLRALKRHMKKHDRRTLPKTQLRLEPLQQRWLLSTLLDLNGATAAPDTFTFTDPDGDDITLELQGGSANVVVTADDQGTANQGDLDNGDAIQSIQITGASANFRLVVSVDSTGGDGVVNLGVVTSDRTFNGLFTVGDTTAGNSNFSMESFHGVSFSDGGGLFVDTVTGNGSDEALVLTGGLPAGRVINVTDSVDGDVRIAGALGGTFNVGGDVGDEDQWTFGPVAKTGYIGAVGGDYGPNVLVRGNFAGMATVDGDADGVWLIQGSVTRDARFQASQWDQFRVTGNFDGNLVAVDGDNGSGITAFIGGHVLANANFLSNDDLSLDVTGNMMKGALGTADGDIVGRVGGDMYGRLAADDDVTFEVGGDMKGAQIDTEGDITLGVAGNVTGSEVTNTADMTIHVAGNLQDSTIFSGDGDVTLDVDGNVLSSRLSAGDNLAFDAQGYVRDSLLLGSEGDCTINIAGDLRGSQVSSESDITVDVGGHVVDSTVYSGSYITLRIGGNMVNSQVDSDSEITLRVGGQMRDSFVGSGSYVTARIGGGMLNSAIAGGGSYTVLNLHGDMVNSHLDAGGEVTAAINGNMRNAHIFSEYSDISLYLTGNMYDSTVHTGYDDGYLTAHITGDVKDSALEAYYDLTAWIGGSLVDSHVTSAESDDMVLDVAGNVTNSTITSGSTTSLFVGGDMTDTSVVTVGADTSLTVGGDLVRSSIVSEYDLSARIKGSVIDSALFSESEQVTVTVGGDMLRSQVFSGESDTAANVMVMHGNMTESTFTGEDSVTLTVDGNMVRSTVYSDNYLTLTVGGNMVDSRALAELNTTALIRGDFQGSTIATNATSTVTIGGDFGSNIQVKDGDLTLDVAGTVKSTGVVQVAGALVARVGNLDGTLQAGDLDLRVGENVGTTAVIQAANVLDDDADNFGFFVGGTFDGRMDIGRSFNTGNTLPIQTLVGGDVGRNAKFNIDGLFGTGASAGQFRFGGDFNGEFVLNRDLDVDLVFDGNANRVIIAGEANNDIFVTNNLTFLSTGSFFNTGTGNFEAGDAATVLGALTVGGTTGVVTPVYGVDAQQPAGFSVVRVGLPGSDNATFTDANGNQVVIHVSGTTGRATFVSDESVTVNGLLDDGEDIVSIAITGASPDFVLAIGSDGAGGITPLGDVTATTAIRGLYTVDNGGAAVLNLASYSGPGFSSGGGIAVDNVTAGAGNVGLDITGLPAGRVINVTGNADGDVTFGGVFAGTINVGGDVDTGGTADTWTFGNVATSGFIGAVNQDFNATLKAGSFEGVATVLGWQQGGTWTLGQVKPRGRLIFERVADLRVVKNFGGVLGALDMSGTSGVTMSIGGNMMPNARIMSNADLTLTVTGNVLAGALTGDDGNTRLVVGKNVSGDVVSYSNIYATIGGNILGGRLFADDNIRASVGGQILKGQLGADYMTVTVGSNVKSSLLTSWSEDTKVAAGGTIQDSRILSGDGVEATLGGSINRSWILFGESTCGLTLLPRGSILSSRILSASYAISATVGGSVSDSVLVSGQSYISMTIGGNITGSGSVLEAEADVSLTVGGSIIDSRLVSWTEDITAFVAGSVRDSHFVALSSSVSLSVAGSMQNSHIRSSWGVDLTVDGSVSRSAVKSGSNPMYVTVGGSVTDSRFVSTSGVGLSATVGGDIVMSVGGSLSGTQVEADQYLTLSVGGSVTRSRVALWGDDDLTGTISGAIRGNVTGSVTDSHFVASVSELSLFVDGSLMDSRLESDEILALNAGGDVKGSRLVSQNIDSTISVMGDFTDSWAVNGSSSISLAVDGNMTNAQVMAHEAYLTVSVGGNVTSSQLYADETVSVSVGGDASKSAFVSADREVSLSVGGDLKDSRVSAVDDSAIVYVDGDYTNTVLVADEDSTLSVGGNFGSGAHVMDGDLTLDVDGYVKAGSVASATGDLIARIGGYFDGALHADQLDMDVYSDFRVNATAQANHVVDLDIDAANYGFHVGSRYMGRTDVATSFDTGAGAGPVSIVDGAFTSTGKMNVTGTFGTASALELAFGSSVQGELSIGTDLGVDLTVNGSATKVFIGGTVGTAAANQTINVTGTMSRLATGSLYNAGTGDFEDGLGAVTGDLAAGAVGTVVPTQ